MTSRTTDPQTSRQAGESHEASGKAETNRQACLAMVCARGGLTAAEIAAWAGLERHEASRRLPELRQAGLIRNGKARRCSITGNSSMTWEMSAKESLRQVSGAVASQLDADMPKHIGEILSHGKAS